MAAVGEFYEIIFEAHVGCDSVCGGLVGHRPVHCEGAVMDSPERGGRRLGIQLYLLRRNALGDQNLRVSGRRQ